jgi:hypothetical protein
MGNFFDLFPRVAYDAQNGLYSNLDNVTNIFFRLRILREVLSNNSSYYEYIIKNTDTPEILAFNVYGDSQAHWVILMANEILDPQYDWPLNERNFTKYIIKKYGTVEQAKTTYHHYEKVITREESFTGITTETRFVINQSNVANEMVTGAPYDTYDSLEEQSFETFNMGFTTSNTTNSQANTGRTVIQITSKDRISNYDWEIEENEKKRTIKVIKPEFYSRIILEFDNITENARNPFVRRVF